MPERSEWAEYIQSCELRERGLRKQSLATLTSFLATAAKWPHEAKREFTVWLCENEWHSFEPPSHNIPHPLVQQLLIPTLMEWAAVDPGDPEPHQWLGTLLGDDLARSEEWTEREDNPKRRHLEKALELDALNQRARLALIDMDLELLYFAEHHLPAGYLGSVEHTQRLVDSVRSLASRLADEGTRLRVEARAQLSAEVLADWLAFQEEGQGDFGDWCVRNGREYAWTRTYSFEPPGAGNGT